MRRGLVLVGIAVAVVGGFFLGTLFSLPPPPARIASETLYAPTITLGHPADEVLRPTSASSATLNVFWVSNNPVTAGVYATDPCAPNGSACTYPTPLFAWADNRSGDWTTPTSVALPVYLLLTNNGSDPTTVSGTVIATYTPAGGYLPTWSMISLVSGAGVVLAIGAVLLFLGLFLPSGVYRRTPPPELSPEELERLKRVPDDDRPPP